MKQIKMVAEYLLRLLYSCNMAVLIFRESDLVLVTYYKKKQKISIHLYMNKENLVLYRLKKFNLHHAKIKKYEDHPVITIATLASCGTGKKLQNTNA